MKGVEPAILLASVCSVIMLSLGVKLPPFFTRCRRDDPQLNDCIYNNIKNGYSRFAEGDDYYHIRKMNPLFVPIMQVKVDDNLYGNLTNGQFDNMESFIVKSVDFDLDKKHWNIIYTFPWLSVHGDYEVRGRLFGLPISGTGFCNITFWGGTYNYSVDFNLNERKGKNYIKIINNFISYKDIENLNFDIKFSQNTIGKALSDVLNNNWQSLGNDITASVGYAMAQLESTIIQEFLDRVPLEDMFLS